MCPIPSIAFLPINRMYLYALDEVVSFVSYVLLEQAPRRLASTGYTYTGDGSTLVVYEVPAGRSVPFSSVHPRRTVLLAWLFMVDFVQSRVDVGEDRFQPNVCFLGSNL